MIAFWNVINIDSTKILAILQFNSPSKLCVVTENTMVAIYSELANIPLVEWQALEDFFRFTNGAYWHLKGLKANSTRWDFSNYPKDNPCYDRWFVVWSHLYLLPSNSRSLLW